jgi:hypothetical protein
MNYETTDEVLIRQNARIIRLLEGVQGWLVGIAIILLVPILIGLFLVIAS